MNAVPDTTLVKRIRKSGLLISHAAEVGVFYPESCNFYGLIASGMRCTLLEPHPTFASAIREHFYDRPNVTCHQVAVFEKKGSIELVEGNASTFVKSLPDSPSRRNDGCKIDAAETFTVNAVPFTEIDDGSIDLLSVDTEGSEWFVLKTMKSRPKVISLETHGAAYLNPYIREIKNWVRNNGYEIWYLTPTDSVYVRKGTIKYSFLDHIRLPLMKLRIWTRRIRKRAKFRNRSVQGLI